MRARISGAVFFALLAVVAITSGTAQDHPAPGSPPEGVSPVTTRTPAEALAKLAGTHWSGNGTLWFGGPTHDDPHPFDATLDVAAGSLSYTWSADGKAQKGTFTFGEKGTQWTDTWHQPTNVELKPLTETWGLAALHYSFKVPNSADWGWKIVFAQRPTGELVLMMSCVKPWGEESRAMRLVVKKS